MLSVYELSILRSECESHSALDPSKLQRFFFFPCLYLTDALKWCVRTSGSHHCPQNYKAALTEKNPDTLCLNRLYSTDFPIRLAVFRNA